jgi:hypothetical protein
MVMRMLDAGGMPVLTDGIRVADDSNPAGFYELERVKELDKETNSTWLKEARGKAVKIISFLLPYLPRTLNYQVIFLHRDLHEVIASQNKMLAQRGQPVEDDDARVRARFEEHLRKVRHVIARRPGLDVLPVDYHATLRDPTGQAHLISAFVGGSPDPERMVAVVDERLYRIRR